MDVYKADFSCKQIYDDLTYYTHAFNLQSFDQRVKIIRLQMVELDSCSRKTISIHFNFCYSAFCLQNIGFLKLQIPVLWKTKPAV